jgi:hypothetical protein
MKQQVTEIPLVKANNPQRPNGQIGGYHIYLRVGMGDE